MDNFIFDLDGTLIDSLDIWSRIDIDFLARYNISIDYEFTESIKAYNFEQAVAYIIDYFKLDITIEQASIEIMEIAVYHYAHSIEFFPNAIELIKTLHRKGKKISIATSSPRILCESILTKHNLIEYFNTIVYSSELFTNKNEPLIFLETAKMLNADPIDCVVIEDLPSACRTARNIGMSVYGMAHFIIDDQYLNDLSTSCDKVFFNIKELYNEIIK